MKTSATVNKRSVQKFGTLHRQISSQILLMVTKSLSISTKSIKLAKLPTSKYSKVLSKESKLITVSIRQRRVSRQSESPSKRRLYSSIETVTLIGIFMSTRRGLYKLTKTQRQKVCFIHSQTCRSVRFKKFKKG